MFCFVNFQISTHTQKKKFHFSHTVFLYFLGVSKYLLPTENVQG